VFLRGLYLNVAERVTIEQKFINVWRSYEENTNKMFGKNEELLVLKWLYSYALSKGFGICCHQTVYVGFPFSGENAVCLLFCMGVKLGR
jgi:hypothetical protein